MKRREPFIRNSLPHGPQPGRQTGGQALFLIRPRPKREGGHVLSGVSTAKARGAEGFTLMELIITIAILAILLVAATLVINPIERIAEANDSKRQQDLSALSEAITFTQASGTRKEFGGIDPDGALTNRCTGESNQTVFVSVLGTDASGTCDSPPDDLPSGWTYRCAPDDGPGDIDGTGWLPVDLTAGGAIQSAISNMPRDSESTFSTGFYYTYTCRRNGDYEVTARMVSDKFRTGGDKDIQSTDGGDDIFVYETGTDLQLDPKAPIGHWGLDEGSGTLAADDSGYGHDGNFRSPANNPAWVTSGCVRNNCVSTAAAQPNPGIDFTGTTNLEPANDLTMGIWLRMAAHDESGWPSFFAHLGATGPQIDFDPSEFGRARHDTDMTVGLVVSTSPSAIDDNAWHLLVTTRRNDDAHFYLDGSLVDSNLGGLVGNWAFTSSDVSLGSTGVAPTVYYDEPFYYDRALTDEEIKYHYDALKP